MGSGLFAIGGGVKIIGLPKILQGRKKLAVVRGLGIDVRGRELALESR